MARRKRRELREKLAPRTRRVTAFVVREATADDERYLWRVLGWAAAWRPGAKRPSRAELAADAANARYLAGWGRDGDVAFVAALPGGQRAGAAWYRRFPAADPGYGFVDQATPELAVGVRPRYRGNGIGEALIEALCERAKADGHERLSLSVEQANPAAMLYTRLGFRTVTEAGGSWAMVRVLG